MALGAEVQGLRELEEENIFDLHFIQKKNNEMF
jgi:hypothetical protein